MQGLAGLGEGWVDPIGHGLVKQRPSDLKSNGLDLRTHSSSNSRACTGFGSYINRWWEKSPSFFYKLSLSSLPTSTKALFSLFLFLLLVGEGKWPVAAARRPAVVGGGAAAVNVFFYTFFGLSLLLPLLVPFLTLKASELNPKALDLKK